MSELGGCRQHLCDSSRMAQQGPMSDRRPVGFTHDDVAGHPSAIPFNTDMRSLRNMRLPRSCRKDRRSKYGDVLRGYAPHAVEGDTVASRAAESFPERLRMHIRIRRVDIWPTASDVVELAGDPTNVRSQFELRLWFSRSQEEPDFVVQHFRERALKRVARVVYSEASVGKSR